MADLRALDPEAKHGRLSLVELVEEFVVGREDDVVRKPNVLQPAHLLEKGE